jgi:glycosyltransferase involved in cell wall biosynthesis
VLRRADLVLAISERMRADLVRDGIRPERVVAFPLGAPDHVPPPRGAVDDLRRRLGGGDGPVVLYFGSIAPVRRLGFLIQVASIVRGLRPEVRWILLGAATSGEDRRLRALAEEFGVADRVLIAGPVPRDDVVTYLELSELTVSPIPPTELYLMSSPMKAVESLAAGRAVVATAIPDQAELIERSGGGVVASYEPNAFADAVVALLSDDERRHTAGASGRAYVKAHRSYLRLAADVDVAYRALLGIPA